MFVADKIKRKLEINIDTNKIILSKKGLVKHIVRHNHSNMLKYVDNIEYIINNPDYIGKNPREKGISLEYLKVLDDNVLVAVKLDNKNNYFYVASVYEVTDAKLKSMLNSGRIRVYNS